jgi:hypothetical protein
MKTNDPRRKIVKPILCVVQYIPVACKAKLAKRYGDALPEFSQLNADPDAVSSLAMCSLSAVTTFDHRTSTPIMISQSMSIFFSNLPSLAR